jgi:hypothetical protein
MPRDLAKEFIGHCLNQPTRPGLAIYRDIRQKFQNGQTGPGITGRQPFPSPDSFYRRVPAELRDYRRRFRESSRIRNQLDLEHAALARQFLK